MKHKLFFLSFLFLFQSSCLVSKSPDRVCYQNTCFEVELAVTSQERQRGLQFRPWLHPKKGILFIFAQPGRHGFWMKETLIPLDMIWLDYGRKVVHLEEHVPPCGQTACPTYVPLENALYVLELNAGTAEKIGLKKGGQLEFHAIRF